MQNTRLNTIVETITDRLAQAFRNPWRRFSLLLIGLLLGFFLGSAIATSAGQQAQLDILAAFILVLGVETVNRFVYRGSEAFRRSLLAEVLTALKIGMTYSLFLEAFKLGS
jgi:hypothetical protein